MTLTLFSRSLHYKDSKKWALCALLPHESIDWLDFGDFYPVFKVTPAFWNSNFGRKKLVCTLTSWINIWNLTKQAQILQWDGGKKWLDFSDLDLIFKVTLAMCWGGVGVGLQKTDFFAGPDRFLVCKADSVCIKRIFFGPKNHTLRIIYRPNYLD